MKKGQILKTVLAFFLLSSFFLLYPPSAALANAQLGPSYPNLESFSIENSPLETYVTSPAGNLTPSYFFPELQGYKTTTLHDNAPLNMTKGSFNLSGETGPDGNVTGSFTYEGYAEKQWEKGDIDLYQVTVNGQITNAKAAYDDKGFLRIMGAAHYERKFEFSGPVTITMKYSALVWDEEAEEQERIEGNVSAQAQIAFVSCISNEEEINLCHFDAGKAYGDYGLDTTFVNSTAYDDFVWFNNLDFEFQLIKGINFDPEAHHKLTPEAEEEDQPEEMIFDESYLDAPEKAEEISDNPGAEFSASLACNSEIYPEDGIACNLTIASSTAFQPYTVNWIMDGYVIKSSTVILDADNFVFPNPPPGIHSIQVQVINQSTFDARVSSASVEILMPADFDQIKPWTQAMAGAGSVAILGAWLWSEWATAKAKQDWFDKWYEDAIKKDRNEWYDKQMAINDEKRGFQKKFKDFQKAIEDESKRFRNELIKITNKYENSDYLIDLYNDMLHDDVYRDGKWDAKQLLRLEEYINNQLKIDRQAEGLAEWKRQMDSLNKRQEAFTDLTYSWTAAGIEIVAGLMTSGASEVIFIPMRAIGNALYAKKRAELLGKTGWNAAKHVMIEAGSRLAIEGAFAKLGQVVIPRLLKGAGKAISGGAKLVLKETTIESIEKWWTQASKRFTQAPKQNGKLPVIKNNWGKGPRVYVDKPLATSTARVDFGMDNYLNNRIRPISSGLADDMAKLFKEGVDINPKMNNLMRITGYSISPSDEIAVRLLNNSAYKDAVGRGVVPTSIQQAVYQARDKICKNAIQETFKELDNVLLGKKLASSYIKSVAITGTGAKPLSPQGIGRFTDFDSTVIAGESEMARKAEKMFADTFYKKVATRLNTKAAEVKMFPGIHAGELGANKGGYISEPMLHWHKVDLINRGRSAVRLKNGRVMFDAHPDVAPMKNYGPMDPVHFPNQPELAVADARGVVMYDVAKTFRETGVHMTREETLIKTGKQLLRAWKANNAGKGLKMPAQLKRLAGLKNSPGTRLSPKETSQLWKYFSENLDLPPDIGAHG